MTTNIEIDAGGRIPQRELGFWWMDEKESVQPNMIAKLPSGIHKITIYGTIDGVRYESNSIDHVEK
jgi:hypothetical protein